MNKKLYKKIIKVILWLGFIMSILGVGTFAGILIAVNKTKNTLPSYNDIKNKPTETTIRVFSDDDTLILTKGPEYGEWIKYKKIPKNMKKAIISIEDRRFYKHYGVDPIGIGRAIKDAWDKRGTNKRKQGASTITQQLSREIFLNRNYSYKRKIDEIIVALAMEQKFSKSQILELYLNKIYFGGNAYGIDAASRRFYNHSGEKLTIKEAALLAGLVKAPSNYAPSADAEAAIDRMNVTLSIMKELNHIKKIPKDNPEIYKETKKIQNETRHFTDWIMKQLPSLVPDANGNIDIKTTININAQNDALNALRKNAPKNTQGAIVSMQNNGAIKAMVGGLDWQKSMYNRATEAYRQPGSAFKAFVYLTALEAGYKPSSLVQDRPISIGGWSPRNSNGKFNGPMTLNKAFAFSTNSVAVRLGKEFGFENVAEMAYRMGISNKLKINPSLALGASEVRLIDLTRAYAQISSKGVSVIPHGITEIKINGNTEYKRIYDDGQQVISKKVASDMTALMVSVIENGTGGAARINRDAAGKTGTTSSNKDGWFVGFSSNLTTGVWIGRDDAKTVNALQGGRAPAVIFSQYMQKTLSGVKKSDFEINRNIKDNKEIKEIKSNTKIPENNEIREKVDEEPKIEIIKETKASNNEINDNQNTGKSRAIRPD